MMSDAPAHHIFCLLGPITKKDALPEILVVIQVCLEGQISSESVSSSLSRGRKAAGDLIPWSVSEQFNDREFPKLAGARVVRIFFCFKFNQFYLFRVWNEPNVFCTFRTNIYIYFCTVNFLCRMLGALI